MRILHIETTTEFCSAAIFDDGAEICYKVASSEWSHASSLMPLIDELFTSAGIEKSSLNAVSVSSGPGSYTGLRIGVSTAKGICYALNIPLIAVGSLHIVAEGMSSAINYNEKNIIIPMVDARRMEVFAAIYDSNVKEIKSPFPWIIDADSFNDFENKNVFLGGNGAEKLKQIYVNSENIAFIDENFHDAKFAGKIAFEKFQNKEFVDLAYFEPDYGKNFVPGKPSVKGLK